MGTASESSGTNRRDIDTRIAEFIATYKALSLANNERILSRLNMSITAVSSYVRDMTIVDLHSDETWTVSLSGTAHCDHAQVDRTGANALKGCSPKEKALRIKLAEHMFKTPCGLLAPLAETFEDGSQAELKTVSLPLLGDRGERKIVTYALIATDISEPYGDRPVLTNIAIATYQFVDLGYGVPVEETSAAPAKTGWPKLFPIFGSLR